jgi:hypothetical protein
LAEVIRVGVFLGWDLAKDKIDAAGTAKRTSLFRGYIDEIPIGTFYDGVY